MVAQDLAEVGQADKSLAVIGEQADPGGRDPRINQEAGHQQERGADPEPGPNLPVLGGRQAADQPVGEDDVEDEHHRDADDGAHQERDPFGVHGGLSLPT